ncbi:hypothetical protein ACFE04_026735 [Oxalis oulophora]
MHLQVELAHGGGRCSARNGISRHSEYRVIVQGLPSSASWQDLKDHMRKAGDAYLVSSKLENADFSSSALPGMAVSLHVWLSIPIYREEKEPPSTLMWILFFLAQVD